jgi:hypothetical protein
MKNRYPHPPRQIITITDDLIRESKQRDSSHCMIAEAVRLAVSYHFQEAS